MQTDNVFGNIDWGHLLQQVIIAVIILVITWLVARLVKWAIAKLVTRVKFLQRETGDGRQLGESIGKVGALIVWLFGLVAILQLFALSEVLSPVQDLLTGVMAFIPNLIGAGFIFFIGYIIARIVKQLLITALGAVDFTRLTRRLRRPDVADGVEHDYESQRRIVEIIANVVFALILLVVAISALQVLGISAIADPARQMLEVILTAIPQVLFALVLLGIGFLIAKFVGQLLESTLHGVGTDRVVAGWGIVPEGQSASGIIATIVKIAIMLFFGVMAAGLLNFPVITDILNEILNLGGRVLFGGAIIAAGFVVANVIGKLMGHSTASKIIRYTTIGLFVAMGLRYMGIADSIINMAFGAVVIGAALAAALAFGLGGRNAAARTLDDLARKGGPGTPGQPPATDPFGQP